MRTRTKLLMILSVLGFLAVSAGAQGANVPSNQVQVPLSLTIGETLTVSVTPPASPTTFAGSPPTTGAIQINTTATLTQTRTVTIWAWFANAFALAIPMTMIEVNVNAIQGTASIAAPATAGPTGFFTASSPFGPAGTGFQVAQESIAAGNNTAMPTANLTLSIPGGTGGLQAGTYTGTLFIAANAI